MKSSFLDLIRLRVEHQNTVFKRNLFITKIQLEFSKKKQTHLDRSDIKLFDWALQLLLKLLL